MDYIFKVTYTLTVVEFQNLSYKGEILATYTYVFLDISILNKKPNNSETLECVRNHIMHQEIKTHLYIDKDMYVLRGRV